MNKDKINQERKDNITNKAGIRKDEILTEEIKELQTLGVLKNEDLTNKTPRQVLEEHTTEIVEKHISPIADKSVTSARRTYRIDDKLQAIMFMEAFQEQSGDKMTPKFQMVSRWLDYPANTIKSWWNNKDKILKQKNTITENVMGVTHLKLSLELLRMAEALSRRDYDQMSDKDLILLINTVIPRLRLLGDKSTSNVEHKHSGSSINLVIPKDK